MTGRPTRHGILLSPEDAAMLVDCVDFRIEALKAEIKDKGLNKEQFRPVFQRLLAMRKRLQSIQSAMTEAPVIVVGR